MSEVQHGNPFEAIGSEVVDALNLFDESRSGLYLALTEVAETTPDVSTYHPTISPRITDVAEYFGALASALRTSEDDIDTAQASIMALWVEDDAARVERFRLLSGGDEHVECFKTLGYEDASAILADILQDSEDDEAYIENITMFYQAALSGDVETLSHHIQERRLERLARGEIQEIEGRDKEIVLVIDVARVKQHMLDVAKIAVGVTLGLAIHKKLSK